MDGFVELLITLTKTYNFFLLAFLQVCLKKLKYAIRNTELMDADFIDRRATSGWENIR